MHGGGGVGEGEGGDGDARQKAQDCMNDDRLPWNVSPRAAS